MLIKDLLKEFTFELQIKNYSKRTIETYNYNVNQFIKYLEEQHEIEKVEDVSTVHVKKFVQYEQDKAINQITSIRLSKVYARFITILYKRNTSLRK